MASTTNHSAFWLVTASTYQQAVQQWGALDNATPLFDSQFSDALMPLSPWLIAGSSLTKIDDDALRKGITITTKVDSSELLTHLRSLLWAFLEGEEVLFRFYDPVVIIPMLTSMDERERQCFLGNIESWLLWDGDRQVLYSNTVTQQFKLQEAPWWKIKETHLTPRGDVTRIASNIERRLWSTLPQAMNALSQPKHFIESAIHQFEKTQRDAEDTQLFVLSCLIKESNMDINDIAHTMHLSSTEVAQLNTFIRELT